jgi:hypothetical protein
VGYSASGSTLIEEYAAAPPDPIKAVSRKVHRVGGIFDIDLLAGGVECRNGVPTGNDHQVVITFPVPVTVGGATLSTTTGAATADAPGVDGAKVTVNLHNVSNAQRLTVTLTNVNDGTHTGDISVPMSVLLGDVDGNGVVDDADVASVTNHIADPLKTSNFRNDVTVNSIISRNDVNLTTSEKGTRLP